jgi:hypothetical protein
MRLKLATILALTCVTVPVALQAHHSFAAEYDSQKMMTVTGTVTKVEWTNPHVYVHVSAKDASGKMVNYAMEGYPPNTLKRTGFAKDMLKEGMTITISAYVAKDGSNTGAGREVTFPDGSKKYLGPVGR